MKEKIERCVLCGSEMEYDVFSDFPNSITHPIGAGPCVLRIVASSMLAPEWNSLIRRIRYEVVRQFVEDVHDCWMNEGKAEGEMNYQDCANAVLARYEQEARR